MITLPPLEDVLPSSSGADSPFAKSLAILFEPSQTLYSDLVPGVVSYLQSASEKPGTYSDLIDDSLKVISTWTDELKARFIAGHPRIGEVKGLSHLSAKEQAAVATPPEVLARLAHLNACYEHRYPELRYITFVNGRTRTAIKEEMEVALGLEPSLSPDQPAVESLGSVKVGGEEWRKELERAVMDVGRIAKSRLKSLGAV
ncbi:hypothetical protein AcW1_006691 [Taiwanofungus camphoratus]|nr:hypothetical protein AcV5_009278 [Antrodia cinnamomea]KAI0924617.1 hypothetical protein AcW2_005454 [Antrodia cinnamomea]KAI0954022.1 hypothetical protein AcV7_007379 [Antrodia cinnamomea]KAI0954959.1 hypothetical protein AcW1_006691 [Antrodia cinnamomea]